MSEQLKPCPFCGNIPYIEKIPLWHTYHGHYVCLEFEFDIHCDKCGCTVILGNNNTIYTDEK